MTKNSTLIVGIVAAMVVLYLLFRPNTALAASTAAVGTTANPRVTPQPANAAAAAGIVSGGLTSLFNSIAGGFGLAGKTISAFGGAAPPPLDATAQSISDALAQVQTDPIASGISDAFSQIQPLDTLDTLDSSLFFDTSYSPGVDAAFSLDPGATDA